MKVILREALFNEVKSKRLSVSPHLTICAEKPQT